MAGKMKKSHQIPAKKRFTIIQKILLILFAFVAAGLGYHYLRPSSASAVVGDINQDGVVNIFDLSLMMSSFGHAGRNCVTASSDVCDLNNDGVVNIFDLSIVLANYGRTVTASPPTVSLTANPTGITSGQSSTLSWSSTNATSCTASSGWSGTKNTSGTQSVSPTATTAYTLACTGAGGNASANATVNVSAGGGGSGTVGTGPSQARCNGTCTTPSYPTNGTPISTTDGTGKAVTGYIYPEIPGNLVTNDPNHPVPLVIVFSDGCVNGGTFAGSTKGSACFTQTNTDQGPTGWMQVAAANRFMLITIFGAGTASYWTPTYNGVSSSGAVCGTSGTAACDQIPEVLSAINWAESHYSIDTKRIFAAGGSKGGSATWAMMCDPRTESVFAGLAPMSVLFSANGSSSTDPPGWSNGGSCPAMVNSGPLPTNPNKSARPMMIQSTFSASDIQASCSGGQTIDGISNAGCLLGGVASNGHYYDTYDQIATQIEAPAFGCSTSPITTHKGTDIVARTYTGCRANSNNGTAIQVVDYPKPSCHAYGCDAQQGGDAWVPTQQWNFWTTGSNTP